MVVAAMEKYKIEPKEKMKIIIAQEKKFLDFRGLLP